MSFTDNQNKWILNK